MNLNRLSQIQLPILPSQDKSEIRNLPSTPFFALEPFLHSGEFGFPFLTESLLAEDIVEQIERFDEGTDLSGPLVEFRSRFRDALIHGGEFPGTDSQRLRMDGEFVLLVVPNQRQADFPRQLSALDGSARFG